MTSPHGNRGGDNGAGDLEDVNRCDFCSAPCIADSGMGLCCGCCEACTVCSEWAEGNEVTA